MIKLLSTYNERVANFVLENAPANAKYIAPSIQKEVLHILSKKVKDKIRNNIGASRDVILVHQFFSKLNFDINIITVSSKRHSELQLVQSVEINQLLDMDEIESGRGAHQIGTLQRAGDTRWSSHFHSICSLTKMFDATSSILQNISDGGSTYSQRGDADTAYKDISSFEFVFILHLMKEIMGITDILCQALQQKSQDIVNAMQLVTTTKNLIQNLREKGWDVLLETVKLFCERYEIEIPDMMSAQYIKRRGRCRQQQDQITIEHYYRIDIFTATHDSQLYELNSRFNEKADELLILSSKLDPTDGYKLFDVDSICKLAEKFYPQDFTEQEILHLRFQLQHYILDLPHHPHLKNMSTISELCRGLTETEKSKVYHLIDRLIRLVLTLPVSTTTTERAFSAMKIVKTRLRNKMEDEFLEDLFDCLH